MKSNLAVIGGLYREVSPLSDICLGSGGRASLFLAKQNINITFITSATNNACNSFLANEKPHTSIKGNIQIDNQEADSDITFEYGSYLFNPLIHGVKLNKKLQERRVEDCLYFGMLGVDITIKATGKVVYDPQNTSQPKTFKETASTAGELAIVLNEHEAKAMVGNFKIPELLQKVKEYNDADIVVLKRGPYGAKLLVNEKIIDIPAFLSKDFHKIGSGDIFSACFAYCWISKCLSPIESALMASKAVAQYVETQQFANLSEILDKNFIALDSNKFSKNIYLAGPFFSISELWLIEKLKSIFELYGIEVFSPYHDVGVSNNNIEIAKDDLDGLQKADNIFAIANNFDPGTIFEIGYARALNKNVYMYLEYSDKKDLVMFDGTGCIISNKIDYLIYKAIWNQ